MATKGKSKADYKRTVKKRETDTTVSRGKMLGKVCRQGWGAGVASGTPHQHMQEDD